MKKVNVLGLEYAVTDYEGATEFIIDRAVRRRATSVFALPVHGVVEAHQSAAFKSATGSADLIVPDGQPIKWYMNWVYNCKLKERVYGPILVQHVLEKANELELRLFLYGGATQEVLLSFEGWIRQNYPAVLLVGSYREEVFGRSSLETHRILDSEANIVLCGLGCPSQELWIADNIKACSAVMIGVGAAFSFHSGHLKTAPKWMQRNGLEWLFRLVREPRRLWRRYLKTNSYFILLVILDGFRRIIDSIKTDR